MVTSWPKTALLGLALTALHALGLAAFPASSTGSALSELLQLASIGLAAFVCIRTGYRLRGRPGRFWRLVGLGFACWTLGQLLMVRYVNVLKVPIPAISLSDVPFLVFYLPVFAALFPETNEDPGVDWARTLDLAQVGIVLGSVYLYFFFALNLGVEQRVITLHFGFVDSYSLLNLLLVGSYLYAWASSRGQARALYGRMAAIFALYSAGDTLNTYQVIKGAAFSGDWLDLSYSVPFALATVTASRWPAVWDPEGDSEPEAPLWRLFPLLPPILVLVVAGSVARANLTLATILIGGSFLCFGARLAVTQHRQQLTLERLRRSEAEHRSLVENAPYGICRYVVQDDRFSSVNQALAEMLGRSSREELLRLRVSEDVFQDPSGRERLLAYATDGEPRSGLEVEWKRADGTPLTVRLRTQRTREGRRSGVLLDVSAEDITEHRRLEEQLRQATKMEAVGRLAGGVAHDFNNLLMVVTGAAELIRRRLDEGSPHLPHVRLIQKATQDATDLTRQLLAFGRRQTLEPKVLDLNQVVTDMSEMLPRVIEESIELRIRRDPALGPVRADVGQMGQVVMNLAVNARDAMPKGGTLTLETGNVRVDESFARLHPGLRPGSYVGLTVSDTGRGMDAETSARIFEPFFTTKEKGKGTGLGLAMVYGIVKQSGGHIRVETELGRGSTFIVLLPRFEGQVEAISKAPPAPREQVASETVLLVEDSVEVRGTLREFLASLGYRIVEADSAEAALDLAQRRDLQVDVVIADVVLPGLSGIQLGEELRVRRPGLPVILMSGYAEQAVAATERRELTLLHKPFSLDLLATTIRRKLADAGAPTPRPGS